MSREQLIEMAALEVFGLLDEYESSLYTRSFHYAPVSLQEEIIELQAELVSDDSLLPNADPDPSLRERVLLAVRNSMLRETAGFAPIATISHGVERAQNRRAEDRSFNAFFSQFFWRAATFVLASALVAVSFFAADSYSHSKHVVELALQDVTDTELSDLIGPTFRDFVENPKTAKIAMQCPDGSTPANGLLCIDEDSESAFILVFALPQTDENYTLSALLEDGSEVDLTTFISTRAVMGVRVALDATTATMLGSATFRITNAAGAVVLQSA